MAEEPTREFVISVGDAKYGIDLDMLTMDQIGVLEDTSGSTYAEVQDGWSEGKMPARELACLAAFAMSAVRPDDPLEKLLAEVGKVPYRRMGIEFVGGAEGPTDPAPEPESPSSAKPAPKRKPAAAGSQS